MTISDAPQKRENLSLLKQAWRQLIKTVADLRLAIVLLLAIAVFSISGTLIEQGESIPFYQENYTEDPALFGFLTWKVLLILGLNHVYTNINVSQYVYIYIKYLYIYIYTCEYMCIHD